MQDTYDEKSKNAMEISDKIRTEGGLSEAVQLIESVIWFFLQDNEISKSVFVVKIEGK